MFDLEHAITGWRRQMAAGGIKTPEVLDELESHLREDFARQMKSGFNEQQAFELCVRQIGQPCTLTNEFGKISGLRTFLQRLMLAVAALFIAFIVFLSSVTIVVCYASLAERLVGFSALAFSVAVACGWRRIVPRLPAISRKRTRMLAGFGCIGAGFLVTNLFCEIFLVPLERVRTDGQMPPLGFWMAFLITVFTCAGLGLLMSVEERERRGWKRCRANNPGMGS